MQGWGWFNSKGWHACASDLYAVRRTLGPAVSVESQYSADPLGTSTCRYTLRLPVVDLCDAEELDNGLKPCGRTLCVHGRCRKHGGCDRCDDVVDASAFALAADEGARMSRIYGGAAALFGKSEAIRQLIDQHDGPVMVTGVDPATGLDMASTISVPMMLRPARVIEGARVMVIVGGQHLRFFEGIDLSQMAERRLPPLDWDPAECEPIRITLKAALPASISRLQVRVPLVDDIPSGHPNARCALGPHDRPSAYGWCNPLTRPTTIESPFPRPVVPSPWLVFRTAQGRGTPKGWGQGKAAYRHGVGSRRDVARVKQHVRVMRAVARYATGVPFAQL